MLAHQVHLVELAVTHVLDEQEVGSLLEDLDVHELIDDRRGSLDDRFLLVRLGLRSAITIELQTPHAIGDPTEVGDATTTLPIGSAYDQVVHRDHDLLTIVLSSEVLLQDVDGDVLVRVVEEVRRDVSSTSTLVHCHEPSL